MKKIYDLSAPPENFHWFGKPRHFEFGDGLVIETEPNTDFWQRTHYGFRRDNGHALLCRVAEDVSFTTRITFEPNTRYDQCGLFARIDAANWLKASIEYETRELGRLGSVVTSLGYSDWATQDISGAVREMSYRLCRRESDVLIEWSIDEKAWTQMRIAHLHAAGEELEVGVYACSPLGKGFRCRFDRFEIGECAWTIE